MAKVTKGVAPSHFRKISNFSLSMVCFGALCITFLKFIGIPQFIPERTEVGVEESGGSEFETPNLPRCMPCQCPETLFWSAVPCVVYVLRDEYTVCHYASDDEA